MFNNQHQWKPIWKGNCSSSRTHKHENVNMTHPVFLCKYCWKNPNSSHSWLMSIFSFFLTWHKYGNACFQNSSCCKHTSALLNICRCVTESESRILAPNLTKLYQGRCWTSHLCVRKRDGSPVVWQWLDAITICQSTRAGDDGESGPEPVHRQGEQQLANLWLCLRRFSWLCAARLLQQMLEEVWMFLSSLFPKIKFTGPAPGSER